VDRIMGERPLFYLACPECKKKVQPNDMGQGYFCEKCSKAYAECNVTYNFSMRAKDMSSSIYIQVLGEAVGEAIMGMPAADVRAMQNIDGGIVGGLDSLPPDFRNLLESR